ncbi:MAG: AAA family ATPase [Candidatus Omnitrophica bacterium]|nr:AAA family ATPase [Candidatus Omnitrophota bacterium]
MNKIIKFIKIYWLSIVIALTVVGLTAATIWFVYFVAESFMGMEDFAKKQMGGHMALLLPVFLIVHLVALPVMLAGQFFMLHGGAMAKMLGGSDSHKSENRVQWDEVIGMTKAKLDAWEIVEFLQNKKKLAAIGGTNMKGALMYGPPGCGKTYLAKAIATESGLPFLCTVGSEFQAPVMGLGAARIKSLFKKARKLAKVEGGCIIFIDEIDSFARPRDEERGGGITTANNATINQFLTEMDGMKQKDDDVFVLAATNVDESKLDAAIVRSGRFDRKIHIEKPTTRERKELLNFYLAKVKYDTKINVPDISDRLHGFSPADIYSLVKEAGALALRKGHQQISVDDFDEAIGRMTASKEKTRSSTTIKSKVKVRWHDVIGLEDAKKRCWEIVRMLKDRHLMESIGDKSTRCTLLHGPTGAGKTFLAKAIATEADVPFLSIMGSEFIDMYMHEGPRKMREFFAEARMLAQAEDACLIFIDEIDAFARARDQRFNFMPNTTLDQFIREIDELRHNDVNIIVLAATHFPDDELDPALTKIGRFDNKILLELPRAKQREEILRHYLAKEQHSSDIEFKQLADKTLSFSPADLESMVKSASLNCLRNKREKIAMEDLLVAMRDVQEEVLRRGQSAMANTKVNIPWADVIGMEETKKNAWEVVELLRDRRKLKVIGGKIIKGLLMVGPPGCGKTYLAKAMATEAGYPFLSVVGSEFVDKYVGEGARKVRQVFGQARALAKAEGGCIIFFDEIDAFIKPRNNEMNGNTNSENATINQFLAELDGLGKEDEGHVVVLAATNMPPETLDPAVMRSGRFDRKLEIMKPSAKDRAELLRFYIGRIDAEDNIDIEYLADKSKWFAAADIDNMVREAGIFALRDSREKISMEDLKQGMQRVMSSIENMGEDKILGEKVNVKWDEVIGMPDAKEEALEIVKMLKDRNMVKAIGGKIVKGVILFGPPGCGKTYLAKAMATEAGFPFISKVGSEFVTMWVGEGGKKMRDMFKEARALAKTEGGCIIFIDEIDAFARPRGEGHAGSSNSENATINQFLTEMDGLKNESNNIMILAATNAPEHKIDPAIMRAGRIERKIYIARPTLEERKELFKFYFSKVSIADDVNPDRWARIAVGTSPSDIDSIVREGGLIALRGKRETITHKDLMEAYDRITLGAVSREKYNRKSIMRTAYHEAGHAIMTYLVHPSNEVIKATVKPRKGSLGMIQHREIEELAASSPNREQWLADIQVGLAGYVAEKLMLGTTASGVGGGPGSDFHRAMRVATYMVRSLGMGDSGLIGDFTAMEEWALSERTKQVLEDDAQKILQDCLQETTRILTENKAVLEFFGQELLEKGDLEYDEVQAIFNKFQLKPAAVRPVPEESEETKES